MSIEADNLEHQTELETDNEKIIHRLDAVIYLLEIIASVDRGTTMDIVEED